MIAKRVLREVLTFHRYEERSHRCSCGDAYPIRTFTLAEGGRLNPNPHEDYIQHVLAACAYLSAFRKLQRERREPRDPRTKRDSERREHGTNR